MPIQHPSNKPLLPNVQLQQNLQNAQINQSTTTAQTAQTAQTVANPLNDAGKEVKLQAPISVDQATREAVAQKSAQKLVGLVTQHKDVQGNGQEVAGGGDPRVSERRSVISTLLAEKTGKFVDQSALQQLSSFVAEDLRWLKAADKAEYSVDGKDQFSWAQSSMSGASALQTEFTNRINSGKKQAGDLQTGTRKYLDASDNSVIGLSFIPEGDKKNNALVDVLLQFRARTDQVKNPNYVRVDLVGPVLVAEQRSLLSSSQFGKAEQMSPSKTAEFALLREIIASHPMSSVNGVFEARNAVGMLSKDGLSSNYNSKTKWVENETPPGASASPYKSIHHNFSRDTPKNITIFVNEWMFPEGPKADRPAAFLGLTSAMKMARDGDEAGAIAHLKRLKDGQLPATLKPIIDQLSAAPKGAVADTIRDYLKGKCVKDLGTNVEQNLQLAARLYTSVCSDQTTVQTLEKNLFRSGDAWPEVADVIAAMHSGNDVSTLKELGEARLAMRDAILGSKLGGERHELIKFDAQLSRLTCEHLGAAVDRVGELKTDGQKTEALVGVQTALRSAVAAGLHSLKDPNDAAALKGRGLDEILASVDKAMSSGKITDKEYRGLMGEVYAGVARTVQNIRSFVDARAMDVAAGGAQLDPEFLDQFVKQSPLHYATALAEKGMRAGLEELISPRMIANVEGMRVLNSVGPVIFSSAVFADNTKELVKLKPPRDALSIVYQLEEKKMVAVGGLIVDTKHAPGGNSHLNMYAMNNGIPVLALPELRTKYGEFFKTAEKEGGIFVDDSNGEFRMMTLKLAKEQGLVKDGDEAKLRPGTNRNISFLKPTNVADEFTKIAEHESIISPNRPTRVVELYIPVEEVRGLGKECVSFSELATLGIQGRHLAGEKGTVLALLKADPTLGKYVPDGSIVTTGRILSLLKDTKLDQTGRTLFDEWNKPWTHDPKVGVVNDQNFLKSAFYTDADYRATVRDNLQHLTLKALTSSLIAKDGQGNDVLTPAGQKLYDELAKNPALAQSNNWITRSSFTGEDRPGKSGAGQYESFPHLKNPVERVKGVIGVIESTWMPEPVENNIADEINLMHIMPSVTVQHCLNPQQSGVMISRDVEHGTRNTVSYQLVKGFGGGVEGGKTEEGIISASGHSVKIKYPGEENGLVPASALQELRQLVLGVEKHFHEVVEKGKGHAVDMEVARVDGQWQVVQARVILMDK